MFEKSVSFSLTCSGVSNDDPEWQCADCQMVIYRKRSAPTSEEKLQDVSKPFQRKGSKSNAHVGRDFEKKVRECFSKQQLPLINGVSVSIGISGEKAHFFDLGNAEKKVLVECKAHKWTEGGNVPSAKLSVWNEAMFLFYAAPQDYRKILVVLYDFSSKRKQTLGEYYIRTYSHLIPEDVEVWEYDESNDNVKRIK